MSEHTSDDTARQLIESVFDGSANAERAAHAETAFHAAVTACRKLDFAEASRALTHFVRGSDNAAQGCMELCAAGACLTAGLLMSVSDCDNPNCSSSVCTEVRINPSGACSVGEQVAALLVNATADRDLAGSAVLLATLYELNGAEQMQDLVAALVHIHVLTAERISATE